LAQLTTTPMPSMFGGDNVKIKKILLTLMIVLIPVWEPIALQQKPVKDQQTGYVLWVMGVKVINNGNPHCIKQVVTRP